ncbi:MAG TPA: response regulator [Patescibacteria group bacterium]|nr:response regulator [Patescibacteria group bacterium]
MAKKVLIIDDDLTNRAVFESVLTDAGYIVTTADDGEDGFNKLSLGGFDLIIMDVMMPKLDGLGVLTKIEETNPKPTNGPIVLFTNLSKDPAVEEALKHGASTYLVKSELAPDVFVRKVQELIGQ